jgi:hypothetical protein
VSTSEENPHEARSERDAVPLGAEVAPPGEPRSPDGAAGPGSEVAGPSYPPAETEPDAHRDSTLRGLRRVLHRDEG